MRLTETLRKTILHRLVQSRYAATDDGFRASRAAMCQQTYKACYKPRDLALMKSLPEGWLPERKWIKFGVGLRIKQEELEHPVRLRYDQQNAVLAVFPEDHEITVAWDAYDREHEAYMTKRKDAVEKARRLLDSCSSTNHLLRVWPEIAPFIPAADKPNLPAIPVTEVNRLFGLTKP